MKYKFDSCPIVDFPTPEVFRLGIVPRRRFTADQLLQNREVSKHNTLMNQLAAKLATGFYEKQDALVRSVITDFLGRDNWTIEEIGKRLCLCRMPDQRSVLTCDKVPLLEFLPPEYSMPNGEGVAYKMKVSQQYRILWTKPQPRPTRNRP